MNKWLRRALLGGVAMTVMAAGAQADELSALKAQLEALQNRVATIESRGAALPEGVSLITFERGQNTIAADELFANKMLDRAPASRGMTIAITPTADLPAPVVSVELSGYVRAVALWHDEGDNARLDAFDLWGRGQIDVKATTDTAIGRVTGGIQLRGDFNENNSPNTTTVMRTAWATWQMTDALSLTFGHTGQIAALSNVSYGTVATPYGLDSTRRSQVRLTYASGPFNMRFGIEDSSRDAHRSAMPDFAGSLGFNMGMFGFRAGGEVGKVATGLVGTKTGYLVNAGINMDLGSMAKFNAGVAYTKGLSCDGLIYTGSMTTAGAVGCVNGVNLVKNLAFQGNLTINMTETTMLLLSGGYYDAKGDATWDKGWSINTALVWKPVDALQFAVEGDYAVAKRLPAAGGTKDKDLILGVAGWFFF